jgi:GTP-binding protein
VADEQLSTLLDYSYRRHYKAKRGMHGEGSNRTGKSGEELILRVPPGTVAYDDETGDLLGELMEEGTSVVIAKGGRGGRGNARFKTPTNQAPRRWEPGEEGEERRVRLELKLIADVGLVGEPNAGKSTFLASVTAARPKVAPYPFTTLEPNLGVVQLSDFRSFVIADIPGIIEGAHEGKGLGHQFLRHIERTRVLLLMIPADADDPQAEYQRLRTELEAYSHDLAATPFLVALTKIDVLDPEEDLPSLEAEGALDVVAISAVARTNVHELLERLWQSSRVVARQERGESEDGETWWAT